MFLQKLRLGAFAMLVITSKPYSSALFVGLHFCRMALDQTV
jgi:hypothetical protein